MPSWRRAFAAGGLLGLALLAKMTWIILFGLWPVLFVIWSTMGYSPRRDNGETPQASPGIVIQSSQLLLVLFVGAFLLNLGYGFDGSFTQLKDFGFISTSLAGAKGSEKTGNRFADSFLGVVPVPLPKQYVLGIDVQKHDFEDYREQSYLLGEWRSGGWWYYYLYGLAVKTTHGTQVLVLIAVFSLFYFRRSGQGAQRDVGDVRDVQNGKLCGLCDLIVLLLPIAVILALASTQLEFNHHVRYVLPIYGFTFVFIGVTGKWFQCRYEREVSCSSQF